MQNILMDDNIITPYDNLCPVDGDNTFGPYITADFQNNTKVFNGISFFSFCPLPYLTYYWTIVRRNLEWFNGYVWGIHNQSILSTQMAAKVCKMSSQLTISGGYRFEGDDDAEAFLSKFDKKNRICGKLKGKLPILNALGFMLAKIDVDKNGDLDVNFIAGNRYYAQVDDKNKVQSLYSLINMITAPTQGESTGGDSEGYYLVEERYFKRGKPIARYRIYESAIIATSATMSDVRGTRGISFLILPKYVQDYLSKSIGNDALGKEFILPFSDYLGAEIVLNSYSQTGMEDYPCFADSTLANVQTSLYELDWTHTVKAEHKYIAQDFAALPDSYIPPIGYRGDLEADYRASKQRASGFNSRVVKSITGVDPATATPFVFQPLLKLDQLNNDINQILNEVAAGAQFSPVTLAGFLKNGIEKTATEVTADENATRLTIQDKRALITESMNRIYEKVLVHYGIVDSNGSPLIAEMLFNNGTLSNPKNELELIEKKLASKLITHKEAVKKANPEYSQKEVEKMYADILAETPTFTGDNEEYYG